MNPDMSRGAHHLYQDEEMMSDDNKTKILDLMEEALRRGRSLPNTKDISISQKIKGNSNTQRVRANKRKGTATIAQNISGNDNFQQIVITSKPPSVNILPALNSIGNEPLLRQRIKELMNKIGDARKARGLENAHAVLANQLKKRFKIKNNKWTIIWDWPVECADDIIAYLEGLYEKTIPGRMEKAAKREDYLHSRPQLYKREKELLSHFGLEPGSPQVKASLVQFFGVDSHKDLTHIQHWQWVKYLEGEVMRLEHQ